MRRPSTGVRRSRPVMARLRALLPLLLLTACAARTAVLVVAEPALAPLPQAVEIVPAVAVAPALEGSAALESVAPSPAAEGSASAPALEGSAAAEAIAPESVAPAPAVTKELPTPHPPSQACHYTSYQWSMKRKTGVNRRTISKTFGELTGDEIDPNDARCSVCEENQVWLRPAEHGWPNIQPVRVCDVYAGKLGKALEGMAAGGVFTLIDLVGYRPGRTRGAVVDGLRTQMSNHGYGTAVDINARHNGLYAGCNISPVTVEGIRRCRLAVGGPWDPVARPLTSVVRGGLPYRVMTQSVGWKWGGEIGGGTRDLMHFSLTGF